jgi:hypothetical protein
VAQLLSRPLAEVKRAARRVEPYIAADGSPRWSVRLVGVELAAQRRRQRAPSADRAVAGVSYAQQLAGHAEQ